MIQSSAPLAPPPDTALYYHVAYVLVALIYSGYALSLWLRGRRARARLREADRSSAAANLHDA